MLHRALEYARKGWPVFPLQPRGKTPLSAHGFYEATRDLGQIEKWWTTWPDANIGTPTGPAPGCGLDVIDIDVKADKGVDGESRLDEASALGVLTPDLILGQSTSGQGRHLWIRSRTGRRCGVGTAKAGRLGMDVRAAGGYVVLPGSIHETGAQYAWTSEPTPGQSTAHAGDDTPTAFDLWYRAAEHKRASMSPAARLTTPTGPYEPIRTHHGGIGASWAATLPPRWCADIAATPEGARRDTLNRYAFLAGKMIAAGLLDGGVQISLRRAGLACGLPSDEVDYTISRAISDGMLRPWTPRAIRPTEDVLPGVLLWMLTHPSRWSGRAGLTDWAALTVLMGRAQRIGTTAGIALSVRDLSLDGSMTVGTARRALERLEADYVIQCTTRGTTSGTRASEWEILPRTGTAAAAMTVSTVSTVLSLLQHDAFTAGGLGRAGVRVLALLMARSPQPMTAAAITHSTGLSVATVRATVRTLTRHGLIRVDGPLIVAAAQLDSRALDQLAVDLGVAGTIAARRLVVAEDRSDRELMRRQAVAHAAIMQTPPDEYDVYEDPRTGAPVYRAI
ncbi:helix-turn-helix domain-containing protein [Rhodococcus hoagii]|nr:helix-turn-helix domain-containing protein [Prescottella equi]NKS72242.1 helix-turn-helix domain-containing protein [Prescottella equi]